MGTPEDDVDARDALGDEEARSRQPQLAVSATSGPHRVYEPSVYPRGSKAPCPSCNRVGDISRRAIAPHQRKGGRPCAGSGAIPNPETVVMDPIKAEARALPPARRKAR